MRRRRLDPDEPVSARARIARREADWAAANADLDELLAIVTALPTLELRPEQRPRCKSCGQRMIVDRVADALFVWRCHVIGHPARSIDRSKLAAFVRGHAHPAEATG